MMTGTGLWTAGDERVLTDGHATSINKHVHGIHVMVVQLVIITWSVSEAVSQTTWNEDEQVWATQLPQVLAEVLGQQRVDDGVEAAVEVEHEECDGWEKQLWWRHVPVVRSPRLPHGVHLQHNDVINLAFLKPIASLLIIITNKYITYCFDNGFFYRAL